jgi:hypothetical protein
MSAVSPESFNSHKKTHLPVTPESFNSHKKTDLHLPRHEPSSELRTKPVSWKPVTEFRECPTCKEMVRWRDFQNHVDFHRYHTPEEETKEESPIDRSEYRHDRAAEFF